MAVAVSLFIACFIGLWISGFAQQAITAEMEMRMGDPPNLTLFQLWSRQHGFLIEKEFRQRYPGDLLLRKLRVARLVFIGCAIGAFLLFFAFGFFPHEAPHTIRR